MKNILTSILVFGFFSLLFLQKYYEEKIETNHLETQSIIDSLHSQIDSLHYNINTINKYLDSLPLGSPLDTLIVSSHYGWRKLPLYGGWRMHSGTDFYAAWSDTVYSTGHGKIVGSGWNFGYGRQIKISHCSGYESSYAHLYKLFVKVGDSVRLGDPIARAGNSGAVTGAHLHYEISRWGEKTDPMVLLSSSLSGLSVSSTFSQ
jgi:murein DD-endopeptidase MepM/ murein hydrolase activator NlpD